MVKVDKEKCIGCGFCVSVAPEVFELDDSGKSNIKGKCEGQEDKCKEAAEGCPTQAITI